MSAKSIVFVVNCLSLGGAEIQVMRLADGLRRREWEVDVVSLLKPGTLRGPLIKMGVRVHSLNMRAGMPNPAGMIRLRKILAKLKPQIVHSHIVHANLLTRLTRLIARMPVLVCTAHNVREGGRSLELGYRYTDPLTDLTTNVSQAAVDRYVRIKAAPRDRIRFVPNGVDTVHCLAQPEERVRRRAEMKLNGQFIWLAVGRFQEQKDYPNMIHAFARAVREAQLPEARLMIAGSGPLERQARDLAASLGVSDRVDFIGERSDVAQLMKMADAFVLSSAWEGMPLVLQEAAASGLPIVATRVGGNAEVAIEGCSALLVPAKNASALAEAMSRMMAMSEAERRRMGEAGRRHVVEKYDMDRILDQWEGIYAELGQAKNVRRWINVAE